MKKKILTKQIALALAMAGLFPMGQAWAAEIPSSWKPEVQGNKLIIHQATDTVRSDYTYQGKGFGDFETVEIYYSPKGNGKRPLGVYSARYDLQGTNVIVHYVDGESSGIENNDALHLSNHYPHFNVRSYSANVTTDSSDGINLSHDITADDGSLEASVVIGNDNDEDSFGINGNGNLTLTIADGSGIRANASTIASNVTNSITVKGNTDITINGSSSLMDVYHPTAVYAGADSYFDEKKGEGESFFVGIFGIGTTVINGSTKGKGIIDLQGQVNLKLNGRGNYGLWSGKNGQITSGDLRVTSSENSSSSYGVAATNGNITWGGHLLGKDDSKNTYGSMVTLNGQTNYIEMNGDNSYAIYAEGVDINGVSNTVKSGENGIGYLWAKGNIAAEDSGAIVLSMNNAMQDEANPDEKVSFYLNGAAMASNGGQTVLKSAYDNWITSSNVVYTSGSVLNRKNVVSALYADNGTVKISGASNVISSSYENMGDGNGERTVWAQNGGTVNIFGQTAITASNADNGDGNSKGIAVVAGTENWGSGEPDYDMADEKRSHVNITYNGASAVTGDLVAGYGGAVNISMNPVSSLDNGEGQTSHSLSLTGNALAGNGGILNVELGNGGVFTGRADDYQEADEKKGITFYNPQFSNQVNAAGQVNVNLGTGSYWNVTGQSWATSLTGENSIIDLRGNETGGYALHVGKLEGNNHFILNLNHDEHALSDMLYIADTAGSSGIQTVEFANIAGWENMENGETLRFATVNADTSELSFKSGSATSLAYLRGRGVRNMAFTISNESVDYSDDKKEENESYNGTELGDTKPGNELIEENYNEDNSLNWFLTKDSAADELSGAGQTILSMSKVNYSNAVYMDRLNKRMGEARYIDGDDGLWVRLRHDRIGKDDAFRSMNTMFELGYDWHAKGQKDGEHRQGVAFDYMRGTADYKNVAGDGDVRRAGVWLYDTWMGDKGHYSDYVVKYGRLSNDFDIYSELGEKISGDYDNDVWSVSAEYGRKKDIGNDWYFEPQAQMQYAYVTSADYTTSQGTKVELDGIDSLIGRAGFRLGRDTSEGNTVYFKADILHEFLGDQSIRAMDATGTLSTTYENEGTWYDVGFGFAHKMGKDSCVFLDVEHSFGNDNDDTYQINIGLNRAF